MIPWWGGSDPTYAGQSLQNSIDLLTRLFSTIERRLAMATAEIKALEAQVAATKGVMESAGVLLAGLHKQLTEAGTDPAALDAIKNDLATTTDALAAAVAANA